MNKTVGRFRITVSTDSISTPDVRLEISGPAMDQKAWFTLSPEDIDDLVYIATAARKECNLDTARRVRRGRA